MKVKLIQCLGLSMLVANTAFAQSKPADQCLDGICIYDDIGALAHIKWTGFADVRPAQAERSEIERCADANKGQWKGQAYRLCEVMLTRGSKVKVADYVNFFAQNTGSVCQPYQNDFEIEYATALGSTFAAIRINSMGRPVIAALRKNFTVSTSQEHAQLRQLLEKKHPYAVSGSSQRGKATWGGTVDLNFTPGNTVVQMNAESRQFISSFGSISTGVCAGGTKALSVQ
jgi:hypothetical protein